MWSSIPVLSLSLVLVLASETFHPNCSLPSKPVNLVTSPAIRGTFDILWSSVFTLLICTWTIQHLNIPALKPKDVKTCWGGLMDLFCGKGSKPLQAALGWNIHRRVWPRLKWMIISLILPELLIGLGFQNLVMAFRSCKQMEEYKYEDGVEWTLTHAFFANMGGFVLKTKPPSPEPDSSSSEPKDGVSSSKSSDPTSRSENPIQKPDPKTNSVGDNDIGTVSPTQDSQAIGRSSKPSDNNRTDRTTTPENLEMGSQSPHPPRDEILYYFTAAELYAARHNGIITKLPDIPTEEIEDKSKGDFFIKGTAVMQVLWLVVQIIVRGARGLPISQLEVMVLAFSVCAFITYLLCWMKPQNIIVPIQITSEHSATSIVRERQSWYSGITTPATEPIPNDSKSLDTKNTILGLAFIDAGIASAGVIFGASHCLAWDFSFPHPVEKMLWRISAVASTTSLPVYIFCTYIYYSKTRSIFDVPLVLLVILSILAYVLARLYLVVEAFRTLCFLQSEDFISTWTTQVPHIG